MRLITYNIHKGIGGRDRRYDLDRIIEVLKELDADLACLQEVDRNVRRSRFDDQPALLAEALGHVATIDQLVYPRGEGGYGNLILSRWPFRDTDRCSLRKGRRKPRGTLMAVVETPQGPILLAGGHLGLGERERHWQIDRLLSNPWFEKWGRLPALVAMDSNDWRNSLEAGPCAANGFAQVTAPPSRFRSFPAYLPMASLDKVYVRGSITIEFAQVVRTKLTRRASDHLPVVVDFSIGSPWA
jgi:endonuclease/exonuclease/phosphatase family metal-dependent hydrolase